jgi:putative spermidine/putrescine transport system permease protein
VALTATGAAAAGAAHNGTSGDRKVAGGPAGLGRRLLRLPVLGLLPFAIYTFVFLGVPLVAVLLGAFERSSGGGLTFANISAAASGGYRKGFESSLELAIITAIVPGVIGLLIAYAVHLAPDTSPLKRIVSTASGVFANFGGVPLAFLFIATIGPGVPGGVATGWLRDLGFDPYSHGFDLFSFLGVGLVYLYFQIPLMVLVITPALQGLRPAWREAADNLGAGGWQYWRYVGGPVLLPSFLGGVLLLFGSALSAYATADALTSGSVALTSIQIGSFLDGNVIAGQENVGKALGLGLVVVILVAMVVYSLLQRRVSKWLR